MSFTNDLKPKASDFNLLYLEDEKIVSEQFSKYFKRVFKNVYTAENGLEGIEHFKKYDIDIVISDVNMPKMNGLEFSRIIKNENRRIPIVLITANTEISCLTEAIDIGINKFIIKPINIDKLSITLLEILNDLITTKDKVRFEKLSHTLSDELDTKTKELSMFKDDMIAIFTHELKTPLHAIINFSEYIHKNIQKELTPKKIKRIGDLSNKIRANGLAQSSLIETLLDVSKYKAGKMVFNEIQINPKEIINTVIHRYESLYNKEITSELDDINIVWDKKAFIMLYENIFSNALKYSKSKIHITFKNIDTDYFLLTIEDDGDGIKDEMKKIIFEQFEQLDNSVIDREKTGTGLGLYMIKLILDKCNTKIKVTDSRLFGGASFEIKGRIQND